MYTTGNDKTAKGDTEDGNAQGAKKKNRDDAPPEVRQQLEIERNEMMERWRERDDLIMKKLKAEGRVFGLDGDYPELNESKRIFKAELSELMQKIDRLIDEYEKNSLHKD